MRNLRQKAAAVVLVGAALLALASPAVATPREEPTRAASLTSLHGWAELLAWAGQWFEGWLLPSSTVAAGGGEDPGGPAGSTDSGGDPDDPLTPQGGHGMDPDG